MNDCFYVDTRPGCGGVFSPSEMITDYVSWLEDRFESSQAQGGEFCFGVAQRVQSMVNNPKVKILAFGPHAGAAVEALVNVSEGRLVVEVLG